MILKQVIHYPDTNSVEATWVDENGVSVKCHSYGQTQMDMLEADLGADATAHADLISQVRNNQLPTPPAPPLDIKAEIAAMEFTALMPRATREFMLGLMEAQFTQEQLQGNPGYKRVKAFDEEVKALRSQL